jgi:uncharacterized surface protein with fasciclin (FAS1) repeats
MKHNVMRLLALLVVLLLVLAACGGSDEGEATATTDATTADDGEGALDGAEDGSEDDGEGALGGAEDGSGDDGEGALDGAVSHEDATEEDLEIWQTDLNAVGCWSGPVDGTLGPRTEAAIIAFQTVKGLEADGLLGPITKAALDDAVAAGEIVCDEGTADDGEGAAAGSEDDGDGAMADADTIADIVAGNGDFSTLLAAVEAAGLTDALADPEASFTVFAPTNAAFEAWLGDNDLTADAALAFPDLGLILQYHVLGEAVTAADIIGEGTEQVAYESLMGDDVTVTISDAGEVFVGEERARVVQTDIETSNGVIHVIDYVIVPPSLDF